MDDCSRFALSHKFKLTDIMADPSELEHRLALLELSEASASTDTITLSAALDSERTITLSEAQGVARDTGKKIDDSFYFQDAFFEVQNTIFKVHRHEFVDNSPIFRDMFAVATADVTEGLVPDNPIRLDGISVNDFRQLMKVMYYVRPGDTPNPKTLLKSCQASSASAGKLTTAEWIAVLKLSTIWQMDRYRRAAIVYLSSSAADLPPEERVCLAINYRVKVWFIPALNALAQRRKPIGLEECKLVGAECVLKLCQVRERFRHCANCTGLADNDLITSRRRKSGLHDGKARRQNYDFTKDIKEVFAKEIARFPSE